MKYRFVAYFRAPDIYYQKVLHLSISDLDSVEQVRGELHPDRELYVLREDGKMIDLPKCATS